MTKEKISIQKKLITNNLTGDFNLLIANKKLNHSSLDINLDTIRINEALSKGLNPNKRSWEKLSEIAFRTFVPESEESRSKGAGGGDAND